MNGLAIAYPRDSHGGAAASIAWQAAYRMHAFDGAVKTTQIDSLLTERNLQTLCFASDWRENKLISYKDRLPDSLLQKFANLGDLSALAEGLERGGIVIRVDLLAQSEDSSWVGDGLSRCW